MRPAPKGSRTDAGNRQATTPLFPAPPPKIATIPYRRKTPKEVTT